MESRFGLVPFYGIAGRKRVSDLRISGHFGSFIEKWKEVVSGYRSGMSRRKKCMREERKERRV